LSAKQTTPKSSAQNTSDVLPPKYYNTLKSYMTTDIVVPKDVLVRGYEYLNKLIRIALNGGIPEEPVKLLTQNSRVINMNQLRSIPTENIQLGKIMYIEKTNSVEVSFVVKMNFQYIDDKVSKTIHKEQKEVLYSYTFDDKKKMPNVVIEIKSNSPFQTVHPKDAIIVKRIEKITLKKAHDEIKEAMIRFS